MPTIAEFFEALRKVLPGDGLLHIHTALKYYFDRLSDPESCLTRHLRGNFHSNPLADSFKLTHWIAAYLALVDTPEILQIRYDEMPLSAKGELDDWKIDEYLSSYEWKTKERLGEHLDDVAGAVIAALTEHPDWISSTDKAKKLESRQPKVSKEKINERKSQTPKRKATDRESAILEILHRKGLEYFKALDTLGQKIKREWREAGCPPTHKEAYSKPQWRKKIQDEKCKVAKRARRLIV